MSGSLSVEMRAELVRPLRDRPEVARAFHTGGERPVLAFQNDDRPDTVAEEQRMEQELVVAVAPALGGNAREIGFSAGGPEEIGLVEGGELVYERP